jgi:plastocyanin
MRRAAFLVLALAAALAVPGGTSAHPAKHHGRSHPWREETVSSVEPPAVKGPKPPPSTTPDPPKQLAHVQVVAREFSVTPSRKTLAAGRVAVELDNFGQDPHDLRVERQDHPSTGFNFTLAKPGTVSSRKLNLGPGTWKLYCTLPGHEALGMHALITVAG